MRPAIRKKGAPESEAPRGLARAELRLHDGREKFARRVQRGDNGRMEILPVPGRRLRLLQRPLVKGPRPVSAARWARDRP
jgi:hypothetical protein